jgi:protein CpxP
MRNTLVKFVAICSLLPLLALAEPNPTPEPPAGDEMGSDAWSVPGPGPGPGAGFGRHRGGFKHHAAPHQRLMKLMDEVKATDAQKKQIEELLKAHDEKMRNSFKDVREIHMEMRRIGFSADYSDDKVKALLAKLQPVHEQQALEKARLHNAIFKLLTPEQQKKLQGLMDKWEQPRGRRPQ